MRTVDRQTYMELKRRALDNRRPSVSEVAMPFAAVLRTYSCPDGTVFYERIESGRVEFWSTDHPDSLMYVDMDAVARMAAQLETTLERLSEADGIWLAVRGAAHAAHALYAAIDNVRDRQRNGELADD